MPGIWPFKIDHRSGDGTGSVGARLLLAFVCISAFAVLAAGAAFYAFVANTEILDQITERRVPSAVDALELSRQAERIVAAAPDLLTVTSKTQHEALSAGIDRDILKMKSLLDSVESSQSENTSEARSHLLESLSDAVQGLSASLTALDALVFNRLDISEKKRVLLGSLLTTHEAIQKLLSPWILSLRAERSQFSNKIDKTGEATDGGAAAGAQLETTQRALRLLQNAQLEISVIDDTLRQIASAEEIERLKVLTFRLRRSLAAVRQLSSEFDPRLRPLFSRQVDRLHELVEGKDGIPGIRERELLLLSEAEQLLTEENALSEQLTTAVDILVTNAKQSILLARKEARQVQSLSSVILIGTVLLTIITSTLIIWVYVKRNLVARLSALSDSMLAIAGGNLETEIPVGGKDEINQMANALSVFRDTAIEVKRTNLRELHEARRRLTDAIESISEGFSLYDADDRLVVCNSRYREILFPGVESAIEVGMSFESIVRNSAARGLIMEAEGQIESWIQKRLEWHRNPTGPHLQRRAGDRWIQINERKTESGGTVAVYSDVTEIKRAEEALRESEERYALAMKGVNEGLWDWRPATNEVHISPRFAELAGMDRGRDKISVTEWQDRIHPDDIKGQNDAVRAHLRGKARFYEAEYRVLGAGTDYRWVRDRGLGLRDDAGYVYRVVGSMEDVSELKTREEELRTAKEQAEHALDELRLTQRSLIQSEKMASLGQLTAGIAHEIKNPLHVINNFAQTSNELIGELAELIEPALASLPETARTEAEEFMETLKEDLGTIKRHGERADGIVKGMLMHSRRDPGTAQPTDLNALLAESINLAYHGQRASTPDFNVTLKQDLDPEVGKLKVVSQEMMRVFINLLTNAFYAVYKKQQTAARDYTPTVTISSRLFPDNQVQIRVRDNGIGVPPAHVDTLFDPFFTTKPPGEGTGLGLSISRDIVLDQHGGNMQMESEEGDFTEFIITLPRHASGERMSK